MTDFLFTYQHKAREIEALSIIKMELERRGYSVRLWCTFDNHLIRNTAENRAKVAVASSLYDDNSLSFFVFDVCGFSRKIVNMQWEQVLSVDEEGMADAYHNPKGLARYANHLCWGEAPMRRLVAAGVPRDKAVVTGPVHMDLFRQEYKGYFEKKQELAEEHSLDSGKAWCLFISSFTLPNMSETEFTDIEKVVGEEIRVMRGVAVESKAAILKWLENLARSRPDVEFIYRPHPDERSDSALSEMAARNPNFHVIGDLAVKQWVVNSERIYTWYSTSIADVFFAGKTCGILRPVQVPEKYDMSIYVGGRFIKTEDELMEDFAAEGRSFPLERTLLLSYFDSRPERASFQRVCDFLEEVRRDSCHDLRIPLKVKLRCLAYRYYNRFLGWLCGFDYERMFRFAPDIVRRIRHYENTIARVIADREKNWASPRELDSLQQKIGQALSKI